jgi:deazaflavin-dependent oxidoreductase (nitroreductase family)
MKPKYEKPPRQPKWMLGVQMWALRRRLLPFFNRHTLIITTTGRKSGQPRSVPIGFVRDDGAYLALNAGGGSNWYRNALANAQVTLEVDGETLAARAEPVPVDTPERLRRVLDVYEREQPGLLERFFDASLDVPIEQLMDIGKYVAFMRFCPE